MSSIHQLPPSAIQTLTATQVLTTPPSVIKELIENSIDAHSTVISVEVSPNCIDALQVKDNGQGILPGLDRESAARRWWTSKIRKWEDLGRWRGEGGTLGFRGEALASAADMAGGLSVTTRVEGEKVGWVGTYARNGELVSQSTKSVPVGTIVRVTDFFKHLPVRRETAVRASQRNLTQIRRLLVVYALSHPQIRFSLKILPLPGGKPKPIGMGEDQWIYSPSKTVPEAVMKIFGKELMGSCLWIDEEKAEEDEGGIKRKVKVEIFLLKLGLDPSQIPKSKSASAPPPTGHYIFVDSRPMSCSRSGPFKSLLSLYKNYIRSAFVAVNPDASVSRFMDPFIYLNVRCQKPGMYDPNIEPAKDDVLFHDWEEDVLRVVEEVFKRVYGERTVGKMKDAGEVVEKKSKKVGEREVDFSVLLARKRNPVQEEEANSKNKKDIDKVSVGIQEQGTEVPDSFPFDGPTQRDPTAEIPSQETPRENIKDPTITTSDDATATSPTSPNTRKRVPTWGYNMSDNLIDDDDDEYLPLASKTTGQKSSSRKEDTLFLLDEEEETVAARKDVNLSNPWVMAKMNASVHNSSSPIRGPPEAAGESSARPGHPEGDLLSTTPHTPGPRFIPSGGGPGYKIYIPNRNYIGAKTNNSSPFGLGSSSRPAKGVLDRWFTQSSNVNDGGDSSRADPESGMERSPPFPPISGRRDARGVGQGQALMDIDKADDDPAMHLANVTKHRQRPPQEGTRSGFMTAKELLAAEGEDVNMPDHDYEEHGEGQRGFVKDTAMTKFNGVEGPGGVFVRRGRRGREHAEGGRRPQEHPDDHDNDGSIPSSPTSLRTVSPSPPAPKRVKLDKGKGRASGDYHEDGRIREAEEPSVDIDEQLDILFTQPPKRPQNKTKKFIPPLLNTRPSEGSGADEGDATPEGAAGNPSPHQNRQRTATAALGMAVDTVVNTLSSSKEAARGRPASEVEGGIPLEVDTDANTPIPAPVPEKPKHRTRTKSSRHLLPLESVKPEDRMQDVQVSVHVDPPIVASLSKKLRDLNVGFYSRAKYSGGAFVDAEDGLFGGDDDSDDVAGWVGEVLTKWLELRVEMATKGQGSPGEGKVGDWDCELISRIRKGGWKLMVGESPEGQVDGAKEREGGIRVLGACID